METRDVVSTVIVAVILILCFKLILKVVDRLLTYVIYAIICYFIVYFFTEGTQKVVPNVIDKFEDLFIMLSTECRYAFKGTALYPTCSLIHMDFRNDYEYNYQH
eukprot:CFRG6924T1